MWHRAAVRTAGGAAPTTGSDSQAGCLLHFTGGESEAEGLGAGWGAAQVTQALRLLCSNAGPLPWVLFQGFISQQEKKRIVLLRQVFQ